MPHRFRSSPTLSSGWDVMAPIEPTKAKGAATTRVATQASM